MNAPNSRIDRSAFDLPQHMDLRQPRRGSASETAFRDAMAGMAASVGVVTADLGGERIGRTVTAAISLSLTPPSILVSIDRGSRLAGVIQETGGFSYAVLAQDQDVVGDAFAGRIEPEWRFDLGVWDAWRSGHPRLLGAVVALDCEVIGVASTSSHLLFVGGVSEVETMPDRKPLIWHGRRYRSLSAGEPDTQPES